METDKLFLPNQIGEKLGPDVNRKSKVSISQVDFGHPVALPNRMSSGIQFLHFRVYIYDKGVQTLQVNYRSISSWFLCDDSNPTQEDHLYLLSERGETSKPDANPRWWQRGPIGSLLFFSIHTPSAVLQETVHQSRRKQASWWCRNRGRIAIVPIWVEDFLGWAWSKSMGIERPSKPTCPSTPIALSCVLLGSPVLF